MPDQTELKAALDALGRSGFKMNADWEAAHTIAQTHEGEAEFDAIHAFCHRIEGDFANASYWDRRAGTGFGGRGHENEFAALTQHLQIT